ncbi:MAG: prepilin peptidase [Polyangiaceae bacterium]|nr:prepilin peptidase [Polyangiaceae bacterium]
MSFLRIFCPSQVKSTPRRYPPFPLTVTKIAVFLSDLPSWFLLATILPIGACVGSFLNVVIYRLPKGMSLASPPSTCPACSARIRATDNIPVIGWLALRGKARCCQTPISPRYPLVELAGLLLAWALYTFRYAPIAETLPLGPACFQFWIEYGLIAALFAAAAIDMEYMILPDSITLGGALLGLATAYWRTDISLVQSAIGGASGFIVIWLPFIWGYKKLRGFEGMGLGDAKLLLLAGTFFGLSGVFFTLFAGALQGTLVTGILLLTQGKIEEPQAVTEEREELRQAIEDAEGQEKAELQALLDADPLGVAPEEFTGGTRVAFGPFLCLALIEFTIFYEPIHLAIEMWLLGGGL